MTALKRRIGFGLLAAIVLPLLAVVATVWPAGAAGDDDKDFSFYTLGSSVTSYFQSSQSPEDGAPELSEAWTDPVNGITGSPAEAGSLVNFVDPSFSISTEWLASKVSGSSSAIGYDTFKGSRFEGIGSYVHYNAALADLGFDSVDAEQGFGNIVHGIGGGIVLCLYILAAAIPGLFWLVIQLLQVLNPFLWFGTAVAAINPTFAAGMTQGEPVPGWAGGIAAFLNQLYGLTHDIGINVLIPLFLALLLLSLVLFKQLNRGSAIKKFFVRLLFIGLGLPLIGSMYTQVLHKLDDSVQGDNIPATRMILSTWVDYSSWMENNRLRLPAEASVTWDAEAGHVLPESAVGVRNSALAVNKIAHGTTYDGIHMYDSGSTEDAWSSANSDLGSAIEETDANAFFTTIGMLSRYMSTSSIEAASLETEFKSNISAWLKDDQDGEINSDKAKIANGWFEDFRYSQGGVLGIGGNNNAEGAEPNNNPVLAVRGVGLNSSDQGGPIEKFTSGTTADCGYTVTEDAEGTPMNCFLSPLAAYAVLNSEFGPHSVTTYSSEKAVSGFTRKQHNAVSQVGSGVTKFAYYANAVAILLSIALIGFFYAIGMLTTSLRRTLQVVAAVPFATLGSIAAIARVIIYSITLIAEVILVIFLFQFCSEILVSLPVIIEGPLQTLMSSNVLFSATELGAAVVFLMTTISIILTLVVTGIALQVRHKVIGAMDEAVTKMINRFLEVDGPPPGGGSRGGLGGALAAGAGAGAGMAMANRALNPDSGGPGGTGGPKGSIGSTNAGGANAGPAGEAGAKTLTGGPGDGSGGSGGTPALTGSAKDSAASAKSDKATAQNLASKGGLSRIKNAASNPTVQSAAMGAMRGAKAGPVGAAAGAAGGVMANKVLGKKPGTQNIGSGAQQPRKKLRPNRAVTASKTAGGTQQRPQTTIQTPKPTQAPKGPKPAPTTTTKGK